MDSEQQNTGFQYDAVKVSEELGIRAEVLERLVTSFADTLAEKIKALETAFNDNDVLKMRALLHEIRGTSGNLRLETVISSAKIMHEAVKSGFSKNIIGDYFQDLQKRAGEFQEYIKSKQSA